IHSKTSFSLSVSCDLILFFKSSRLKFLGVFRELNALTIIDLMFFTDAVLHSIPSDRIER
ncbi:hypothetical protein, partial [Leptospira borgpetersenii]|uniref:hypothetical protein n=1 Tax=Leptospira borgpetersenii TaxID=174 RepID=UPI001D1577BB